MLKRIILPYGYGQTCNQLMQISHWIPAAIESGIPLYFPGFKRYAHLFSGTVNQYFPRFPSTAPNVAFPEVILSLLCSCAARVPRVDITPFFILARMLPGVVSVALSDTGCDGNMNPCSVIDDPRVAAGQSLWVKGALVYRDCVGLAKHKSIVKEFFSPIPDIQQRVDACIRNNRERDTVLVGIHLRRGDYSKWAGGKYYYSDNALSELMEQMVKLLPERKVRFLMVSNESVDRRNFDKLDIGMGPGDPIGDLYSLAACDYIMGPPSTFSIWASFFGNAPLYTISDPLESLSIEKFTVCA